jgi:hypothetical protein
VTVTVVAGAVEVETLVVDVTVVAFVLPIDQHHYRCTSGRASYVVGVVVVVVVQVEIERKVEQKEVAALEAFSADTTKLTPEHAAALVVVMVAGARSSSEGIGLAKALRMRKPKARM